jgi:hypothetical protein
MPITLVPIVDEINKNFEARAALGGATSTQVLNLTTGKAKKVAKADEGKTWSVRAQPTLIEAVKILAKHEKAEGEVAAIRTQAETLKDALQVGITYDELDALRLLNTWNGVELPAKRIEGGDLGKTLLLEASCGVIWSSAEGCYHFWLEAKVFENQTTLVDWQKSINDAINARISKPKLKDLTAIVVNVPWYPARTGGDYTPIDSKPTVPRKPGMAHDPTVWDPRRFKLGDYDRFTPGTVRPGIWLNQILATAESQGIEETTDEHAKQLSLILRARSQGPANLWVAREPRVHTLAEWHALKEKFISRWNPYGGDDGQLRVKWDQMKRKDSQTQSEFMREITDMGAYCGKSEADIVLKIQDTAGPLEAMYLAGSATLDQCWKALVRLEAKEGRDTNVPTNNPGYVMPVQETEAAATPFPGKCSICEKVGHKYRDCEFLVRFQELNLNGRGGFRGGYEGAGRGGFSGSNRGSYGRGRGGNYGDQGNYQGYGGRGRRGRGGRGGRGNRGSWGGGGRGNGQRGGRRREREERAHQADAEPEQRGPAQGAGGQGTQPKRRKKNRNRSENDQGQY